VQLSLRAPACDDGHAIGRGTRRPKKFTMNEACKRVSEPIQRRRNSLETSADGTKQTAALLQTPRDTTMLTLRSASLAVAAAVLGGLSIFAAAGPAAAAGAYGPDTCRQGYVWREAFPGDHVCVTPAQRARARHDNARAVGRYENSY